MSTSDPPEDPPTLQRRQEAPDTLVSPAGGNREVAAVAGMIERDDPTRTKDIYALGEVIGRGGEVMRALDKRIGRHVAFKRMRSQPTDDAVARFLREARIQARLDHPAIVPVYELGRDSEGRPYFTMKHLTGTTLGSLLVSGAPARQRLLRDFVEVCRAVEFAHAHAIVHRDLKPSNVMLGDYAEVYVLDWGVARVLEDDLADPQMEDIESLEPGVTSGELLGTPGYMAPEQIHSPHAVGRAADLYALGSILFEILAGEPLHPRGQPALQSTLAGEVVKSPAQRRPDRGVPPELDAACVAALAMSPAARPTARELADRIEAYLDGDRDVARRRTLALEELWAARAAMKEGRRADAMRAAGRALALDPGAPGPAELVTALMLQPPSDPPPALRDAIRTADATGVRRHAVTAIVAYLAIASFLPLAMWNGIRKWEIVLGVFANALVMALAAWRIRRQPDRGLGEMLVYALGNVVLIALLGRMAGPFTFVPAVTCVITMSVMAYPVFVERAWLLIALVLAGFLVPIALEMYGFLSPTWAIRPGGPGEHGAGELVSRAGALVVEGWPTMVLVIVGSVATLVIAGIHAATIIGASRQAQHKLVSQAWHLQQLLPARELVTMTA